MEISTNSRIQRRRPKITRIQRPPAVRRGSCAYFCFLSKIKARKPGNFHEIVHGLFHGFSFSLCFAVVVAISRVEVSRNFHEICHGRRGVAQRGELRHMRGELRNARGKLRNARGSLHEFSDSTPAPKNHEDSAPAGGAPREPRVFFAKNQGTQTMKFP